MWRVVLPGCLLGEEWRFSYLGIMDAVVEQEHILLPKRCLLLLHGAASAGRVRVLRILPPVSGGFLGREHGGSTLTCRYIPPQVSSGELRLKQCQQHSLSGTGTPPSGLVLTELLGWSDTAGEHSGSRKMIPGLSLSPAECSRSVLVASRIAYVWGTERPQMLGLEAQGKCRKGQA